MLNQFTRTELLIGEIAIKKLHNAHVAVFGIGGVGSFTVEALARSGVGNLYLFDHDDVAVSNINRQIIATHKTVGMIKVDAMKARILEINPNANVQANKHFFGPESVASVDFKRFDYIVDAIDTVSSKLLLVTLAKEMGIPIISCMGAGNKMDPTKFEVADITQTSVCPLAKVMRKELKGRGVEHLKVVYSKEPALKPAVPNDVLEKVSAENPVRRQIPGSIAFVPSVAGLILAGEVIKDLIGYNQTP